MTGASSSVIRQLGLASLGLVALLASASGICAGSRSITLIGRDRGERRQFLSSHPDTSVFHSTLVHTRCAVDDDGFHPDRDCPVLVASGAGTQSAPQIR